MLLDNTGLSKSYNKSTVTIFSEDKDLGKTVLYTVLHLNTTNSL